MLANCKIKWLFAEEMEKKMYRKINNSRRNRSQVLPGFLVPFDANSYHPINVFMVQSEDSNVLYFLTVLNRFVIILKGASDGLTD